MKLYQYKFESNSLVAGFPHFIFILILLIAPKTVSNHPSTNFWSFVALIAIVTARVIMVYKGNGSKLHAKITSFLVLLTSAYWAILYILELLYTEPLTAHQILILFIMLGIISAGSLSMYQQPNLNLAYMLIIIVPSMVGSLIFLHDLGKIFAFMLALYAAFMQIYVRKQYKLWSDLEKEKIRSESGIKQLKKNKKELELKNTELDIALEKAQMADHAKSMFLTNMSHEIRTPLNGIMGMLNLLKNSKLDKQQAQSLQDMEVSSKVLLTIINDILDFSKIEANQIQLEENDFNLKKEISYIEKYFSPLAAQKKLNFSCKIDPRLPDIIVGDATRLKQILNNLVSNAVKFTNTGSVSLSVNFVDSYNKLINIEFSVSDTGIGIPQNKINNLFVAFSQVDITRTRKYGGTGLGLAVSKALVEKMNGKLSIESTEGKGSTFMFTARFRVAEKDNIPLTEDQNPNRNESLNILLAEDNLINQKVAVSLLETNGHKVSVAENGQIAFDMFKQTPFNLVIMDISMPVMDGIKATQAIRQWEKETHKETTPIIALTANAMKEDREACLNAGMNAYLSKPFRPEELKNALREVRSKMS